MTWFINKASPSGVHQKVLDTYGVHDQWVTLAVTGKDGRRRTLSVAVCAQCPWLSNLLQHSCEQQLPFSPWTGSQLEWMLGEFLPRMESALQQLGFFYSNRRAWLVQVFTNVSEKWAILLTLRTERRNAARPPVASPSSVWCASMRTWPD